MSTMKFCIITLLVFKLHLKYLVHLVNKRDSKLVGNNNVKIKEKRKDDGEKLIDIKMN